MFPGGFLSCVCTVRGILAKIRPTDPVLAASVVKGTFAEVNTMRLTEHMLNKS